MLIPILLKHKMANNFNAFSLILLGCVLLFLFPSGKDGIHLLYGINRWIFSLGSILICTGFYQLNLNLPLFLEKPLQQLGEISYGVYLLHPIVYHLLCILVRRIQAYTYFPQSNGLLIAIAIVFTIIISKLIYRYFESYFIKKGTSVITNFYKS
jgi:peptidoglycan/LPS O-acetylase OafA/YrhL